MANKEKKTSKKINSVDVLAVIVVIILAVGIGYRFMGTPAANMDTKQTYQYVVSIADVRDYTANALEKMGGIYTTTGNEYAGKITNVETIPFVRATIMPDGTVQDIAVPEKYEVLITIETDGRLGDTIYLDDANREIYVGANINWYTKWVYVNSSQVRAILIEE